MPTPPPQSVLDAFGADTAPQLLAGGRGTSYRAGELVLKPVDDLAEAVWLAELFATLPEAGFRVARPVRARTGAWVAGGWSAVRFVAGADRPGAWQAKIAVSRAFHAALVGSAEPPCIAAAQHPWALADRFAWDELAIDLYPRVAAAVAPLLSLITPVDLPCQLIHGDLTGNVLFADGLDPAVIDMAPYWRPAEFATAVVVVDSIVWEAADDTIIPAFVTDAVQFQLLLRATIRRIVELDGLHRQYNADCLGDVDAYAWLVQLLR